MSRTCGYCGKRSYGEFCVQHKPRKPIPKQGKQAKLWAKVRADWFRNNPSDLYTCYICGISLTPDQTTIDHIIPRSNAKNYANRHNPDNLRPSCWTCNSKKGSNHPLTKSVGGNLIC